MQDFDFLHRWINAASNAIPPENTTYYLEITAYLIRSSVRNLLKAMQGT